MQERQRREELQRVEQEGEEVEGGRSDAEETEVENLTGRKGEGEGVRMGSELRRRGRGEEKEGEGSREAGLSQSSASTEDEWEKVSGGK